MKLPHLYRNEKGITLAELLAVFAISGIVVLLIIGVHIYSQKQFKSQTDDALHLTDITIVAKEITKDIRSNEIHEVVGNKLTFVDGKSYELVGEILYKNGAPYMYDIDIFEVSLNGNKFLLKIKSLTEQEIETMLIVR